MKTLTNNSWKKPIRRYLTLSIIGINALIVQQDLNAAAASTWWKNDRYHPVFSIGGGASFTSNSGQSQNFPIMNPITDEYFYYSSNQSTETRGFYDLYLAMEFLLRPLWMLQLGVDYNEARPFPTYGYFIQGADLRSQNDYEYNYRIKTQQLLFEGKLLYTYQQSIHPYIIGGIGAAFNNAFNYATNVPPFLTFTRQYANASNSQFAWAVGLGFDADVTDCVRLGLGYRFADSGTVSLGQAVIDNVPVPGTLSQSHFYTNQVLAQLTWVI